MVLYLNDSWMNLAYLDNCRLSTVNERIQCAQVVNFAWLASVSFIILNEIGIFNNVVLIDEDI